LSKLPGGDRIDRNQIASKLSQYALNPNHRDGKHKARLFSVKLGITIANQSILEDALLNAVAQAEVIYQSSSEYGEKYVVDFILETEIGTAQIRSCWIVRFGEDYPRLVSIYPTR